MSSDTRNPNAEGLHLAIPEHFVPIDREAGSHALPWSFDRLVRSAPSHVICQTATEAVTYDQLNRAANRIAHHILAGPAAASEVIALWLPQGKQALVAILGILKAGKTYTALDPAAPPARIRMLLENTEAGLLLTDSTRASAARALADGQCDVIDLDAFDGGRADDPGLYVDLDANACILFTSGSTGMPKGVVLRHRELMAGMAPTINLIGLGPDDRGPWLNSPSVIGSASIILLTLLGGSCMYPVDVRTEGIARLVQILVDERTTMYSTTPTLFRQAMQALPEGTTLPHMRLVSMGAEPLRRSDIELWRRICPRGSVLSFGLGSTEAGGIASRWIDHDTPVDDDPVPAGYPAPGKEVLILNDDGEPVAPGETGEIVVRGRTAGVRYWRNPELTRARFKPNSDGEGFTFFTGDLGRMRPDGMLVHMGRKDDQVKVRGFRVEVAEAESALLAISGIREAAVTIRPDAHGDNRLIAYVVAHDPHPTISTMRRTLAARLPDYMIPSAYVFIDALPIAGSGKVVRRLLPDPPRERPTLDTVYRAPSSPVEQTLAGIWEDVLEVSGVGIDDPFLDLGGHSLQAARIIARVLAEFRVELPVQTLFETPTVATMAAAIDAAHAEQIGTERLEELLRGLEALPESEARQMIAGLPA